MTEKRDWLRTIFLTALMFYMAAALVAAAVAVVYFADRALGAPPPAQTVVCTGPEAISGPNWGISAMTCEGR